MRYLNQFFYKLHQLLVLIAKIMMVAMVLIVFTQVLSRFFLDKSIRWSEEVPLILMVWFGFISMAIGVKKKLHISIELFYKRFPEKGQWLINKLVDALVAAFGIIMVVYGYKLASFTMTSTLPATKLPTGWLYMAIPVAGVLIAYDSIMDFFGVDKIEETTEDGEEKADA